MADVSKSSGRILLTAYAPVFVWMTVMFLMSSDLGSASNTSRIIRPIIEFLFPNSAAETLDLYQLFIRKLAHFTEYALLGYLATRMFRFGGVRFFQDRWVVLSLGLIVLWAAADEWHQSLVSSRTGSVYDVLLDITGGAFAVLLVWLIGRRRSAG